ncbi:unnamed protein product [Closterium sp. NIES-64]|nr:unnamed protein product [Closterium sp. NIES-64]
MAELHDASSLSAGHVFRFSQSSESTVSAQPSDTATGIADFDGELLRVRTDPSNGVKDETSKRDAGNSFLGRSYSVQVGRGGQAESGEAGGAGGRRRRSESSSVGVNIAALDKALDRVMSMPWRGEKKAGDGDGDGGLGLGAAWQEKAEKNGKHVLGRARSHGNGEGDSVRAAAAAAVAAIRSDGDVVPFANNVSGVPLNKCGKEAGAKDGTNKERSAEVEVGTDGRRGAGDVAIAGDPAWQVDLRRVTLKKEICRGAYSTVYKGAFRDMDVAVKAIDWGEAGSFSPVLRAKQRATLLRQVHVWRGLKHPYVTQLVAASVSADCAPCTTPRGVDARLRGVAGCLIMEYVGDLTVKEYLARAARERRKLPLHMLVELALQLAKGERRKLPLHMLVELALQLAKGLAYIHSSGVVHGDVCPDNLLLTDYVTSSLPSHPPFLIPPPPLSLANIHSSGVVHGDVRPDNLLRTDHVTSSLLSHPPLFSHPPTSLAYIHSSGVVHGDVCPDNLLLTDRRRLKIAGFGVARFEGDCRARGRGGAQRCDNSGSAGVLGDSQEQTGVAGSEAGAGAGAGVAGAEVGGRGGDEAVGQQPQDVLQGEDLQDSARNGEGEERRGVGRDVEVGRREAGEARGGGGAAGGAEEGVVTGGEKGGEAAGGWLPHDASGETGSVGYMAPEVLAGLPYDRRADVYSFGICLWELLTCETPFDSFDFSEMASAISEGVRPILPHKCPPDIARVMRCCWEGSSAARPSMPQVIAMLEKVNVFSGKEIPVHNI